MVKNLMKQKLAYSEEPVISPSSGGQVIEQSPPTSDTQNNEYIQQPKTAQASYATNIWHQKFYRIRKKTLTIGNKYWIEDEHGTVLGFCKQKILKLKEDIRIYTDENLNNELFCIKQKQIMDMWGNFIIIDSQTSTKLGYVRRNIMSELGRDSWEFYDANNQLVGKIVETSLGRGLARKYAPGGALIPEKMTLEYKGQPIAEINQKFKIIGDIWEMDCSKVPPELDRRVLLSCILLMGTIERSRKGSSFI